MMMIKELIRCIHVAIVNNKECTVHQATIGNNSHNIFNRFLDSPDGRAGTL